MWDLWMNPQPSCPHSFDLSSSHRYFGVEFPLLCNLQCFSLSNTPSHRHLFQPTWGGFIHGIPAASICCYARRCCLQFTKPHVQGCSHHVQVWKEESPKPPVTAERLSSERLSCSVCGPKEQWAELIPPSLLLIWCSHGCEILSAVRVINQC